ncbi:MAG: nicotinamide mononucleotide transporter [Rhodoferax sp.]|jgi:nicotinamide mononucleotide transporter|nr:nicotinamide mononucleotide transporter [Rhodoferax sp.]
MDLFSILATTFSLAGVTLAVGDLLGFLTGLACVALTVRAHIGNFAAGILNSAILGLVFFDQRLFADASLQIVFIALSVQGWVQWRARSSQQAAPTFRATSTKEQLTLAAIAAAIGLGLWQMLVHLRGTAPPIDALITALSLCAQWQLNRRQISSWSWWIAVDLISIPLYWSRGLYLIAILYGVFLAMCVQGWRHWRRLLAASAPAVVLPRESLT